MGFLISFVLWYTKSIEKKINYIFLLLYNLLRCLNKTRTQKRMLNADSDNFLTQQQTGKGSPFQKDDEFPLKPASKKPFKKSAEKPENDDKTKVKNSDNVDSMKKTGESQGKCTPKQTKESISQRQLDNSPHDDAVKCSFQEDDHGNHQCNEMKSLPVVSGNHQDSSSSCEHVIKEEHLCKDESCLTIPCHHQLTTKKHVSWDETTELQDYRTAKGELDKRVKRIMLTLYLLAFLASFSFWVQSGVLPYLTRRVGMNTELFGIMESTYAFYQMITSPVYGRLGDLFGVRILYLISELASSIAFGSLALADSTRELFLTRVPALFMHSVQCSYMIITDITSKRSRADFIGKLGVLHGIGMIAGSVAGGVVTHAFNEKTAAVVAAMSNLFSIVVIIFFIPKNTKEIHRDRVNLPDSPNVSMKINKEQKRTQSKQQQQQQQQQQDLNTSPETAVPTLSAMISVLSFKNVKFLLLMKVAIAFPFSLLYSMFSMAVMDYYGLGPRTNGILLGYAGLLSILVQGLVVGALTRRFEDAPIVKTMIFFNTIGYLFLIVSTDIFVLVAVMVPLAVGGSVSHIVLMAVITKIVPPEHSGTALGFIFALHAIVRAIAPTLGGLIFTRFGWPFFGVVGYAFHVVLMVYVGMCGRDDQYDG